MAITQSNVLAIASSGTAASSYTTASGSPPADRVLVMFVASVGVVAHNAPTAWGLTWEQVDVVNNAGVRCSMWIAVTTTAPTPATATINFGSNASTAWWQCSAFALAGPRISASPSTAIKQSATGTHSAAAGGNGSAAASLANTPAQDSAIIGMIINNSDSTAATTAERTGLGSASAGTTPYRGRCQIQWNLVGDTQMTTTWSGTIGGCTLIAELTHASLAPKFNLAGRPARAVQRRNRW